ncbi:MAG: hypothetical protein GY868_19220, partial [Deltaproteobacteria bacterium]|nr:hypothetical protein [Deltaproteobacteria bacterium]
MEVSINEMADQDISGLTNDQKMQFLQTVLFLKEYLNVAKNNSKEKPVKQKIKQLSATLDVLQGRILDDPWIQSVLKVDDSKISISMKMALKQKKSEDMPFFAAIAFFIKFLWDKFCESLREIKYAYKI